MTKTFEQMAEEYADDYGWESIVKEFKNDSFKAYIAGYKAAKDQLADTGKVMNSPEKPDSWISVKERLPEEGEEVLVFGQYLNDIPKVLGVRSRYKGDQDWKYTWEGSDEWVYRENDVTHWMPLPTVEGLKHED